MRRIGFPAVQNGSECRRAGGLHQCMDVIWHHHKCSKGIVLPVKMPERRNDDRRMRWVSQSAVATACIQITFDPGKGIRVIQPPHIFKSLPYLGGKRIGETESDKISRV